MQDAVVMKLFPDLNGQFWGSYLGGDQNDAAYNVKVTDTYEVFVCGGTESGTFPFTTGVVQEAYAGSIDGFITKYDNAGGLTISTYLGTSSYDQTYFLEIDRYGDIYVLGQSEGNYPVTPGVYFNPNGKQFIHKLTPSLDNTLFSMIFGDTIGSGSVNISPVAFLVDRCDYIYLSGSAGLSFFNSANVHHMPVIMSK